MKRPSKPFKKLNAEFYTVKDCCGVEHYFSTSQKCTASFFSVNEFARYTQYLENLLELQNGNLNLLDPESKHL